MYIPEHQCYKLLGYPSTVVLLCFSQPQRYPCTVLDPPALSECISLDLVLRSVKSWLHFLKLSRLTLQRIFICEGSNTIVVLN